MQFIKRFFVILFSVTLLFSVYSVQAADTRTIDQVAQGVLDATVHPTGLKTKDVKEVVGQFIKGALTLVGLVFFILMVYGGFLWMQARGNEQDVEKARDIIIAAIIGLVLIVAAYAITNFVTGAAIKATS